MHYISEEDFKELHHLKERTIHWNYPRSGNAQYPCVPCPNISLGIHPMAFIDLTKLRNLDLAGNSRQNLMTFGLKISKIWQNSCYHSIFYKVPFRGNLRVLVVFQNYNIYIFRSIMDITHTHRPLSCQTVFQSLGRFKYCTWFVWFLEK
jgi:hypothetical protein